MEQVPDATQGSTGPSGIQWEVVKHKKYGSRSLSRVSCLYSLKIYGVNGVLAFDTEPIRNVLLRINLSVDCVLLNKAVSIEILDGISFGKFASKKKNYSSRLQDLSKHFESVLGIILPESLKKSFYEEFDEAAKLLRSSFSI
ncbi:hypothetical protein [Anaplasma phagocytophilum]|uniref:Uncharacterized protein n=5 Tax=Anaplasma phagocytophilum TaxID=948 RepID=A0A098EGE6_ANAPH|nr:hypothetical protein [Anaplasma phagocytophilum]KJV64610.1 hypothetical protein APHMUC_1147 [Anaplasma phagocytophilum str. ApMUC09]KJZ99015.1 hypothetical protein APHCR_0863 [Anaplasma phagocytophilum str. CR1007]ABD43243.1 conserved hypothetical protein [Anaplasma phagocytophilum str. HZ]AGR79129.1 hypothetical protein YYU_06105 [Anaplasma phagocytophilum str. HZ2]AGR80377.1 hypothetical protein WSQ_06170 [Anaplasma phagocytophilum str. JM]